MSTELEVAAAASAGGLVPADRRAAPEGPCRNCGHPEPGRHCPDCGQLQDDFKRPILSLIKTGIQDSFALDGRVMRTLPVLFGRPGRMTRNYLDGQRARYVPPFRLYLLASLIFFLALFSVVPAPELGSARLAPDEVADVLAVDPELLDPETPEGQSASGMIQLSGDVFRDDGSVDREKLAASIREGSNLGPVWTERVVDFTDRIATAYENETLFVTVMQGWAPRISFLQLPVFILLLGLLYVWRRKFLTYDHVITALHLQAFFYLMTTAVVLLVPALGAWPLLALAIVPPVYLTRQLRVTYGDGWIMAGLRAAVLLVLSVLLFAVLFVGVVLTGLYQL